ncbi:ABC transporter ATP-binding protein [Aerococcus sanguinicola]|uniref:ABC transporter ATP-binding protein n=1 Tax=Aerococcus sanguinicola TaxID=119206 RepID=UPI0018A7CC63|nr:ABC transporter ATP-binding protein [Aerococcus sanguinicola]
MKSTELMKRIWYYLRPYRLQFYLAILATVVMSVANALEPYVLGLAITEVANNVIDMVKGVPGAGINFPYLVRILVIYLIRGLFFQAGQYLGIYFLTNATQDAMYDLRLDISRKANQLPVAYFDQNQTGDILSRMTNDVDAISNAMQQSAMQLFIGVLQISLAIISMLLLDWQLALISLVMLPVSYLVARRVIHYSQPIFKEQADALGHLFGYTQENLSGFTEIKVYNRQEESIKEFQHRNKQLRDIGFKSSFLSTILQPLLSFISNISYIVITFFGSLKSFHGTLTVGNLQAFLNYVWQINQPINQITELSGLIQSAFAAGGRIFSFLDEEEIRTAGEDQTLPRPVKGHVRFNQVRFGYDPENPLMKDVNFEVQPGQMIAVVGPTGAGKTTLINLLMRFYDIDGGSIELDGVNIQDVSREDLRRNFGMVLQDAWLFNDTVMENIRFGNLEAGDYEVIEAAKVANVDHFIQTLPGGYQMEINEEASNVSLGQKQLMTIARAVIADPNILILDEATSSVDTRLEQLIQEAMDKIMQGRTSFVIAHRLSTIRNADMILVMQQGDIIEHGTHDELLAKGGFYADLYNSQFNEETATEIHMGY